MSHSLFSVLNFDKYPSSVENHDSNGKGEEGKKIKNKKKKYLINRMEGRRVLYGNTVFFKNKNKINIALKIIPKILLIAGNTNAGF